MYALYYKCLAAKADKQFIIIHFSRLILKKSNELLQCMV